MKYKILVIKHLCKKNHMAKFGEVVDESQLIGNPNELVKSGYIALEPIEVKGEVVDENESTLSDMTKEELIQFAKDNNFEVTEKANKKIILAEIEKQIGEINASSEAVE